MSQTGVVSWSTTAATNATADSAVAFPEGQSPASLNDSARALMGSVAKYRDDLNGSITTGGTSTAYTVASNQVFAALTAGYSVCFCPHATNGATVTLNVDGLGAKPLRTSPGSASGELASGVLVAGTPYIATYFTSNSGEWILHDFYGNPYGIPIAGLLPYTATAAPNSSFVLPYGQAINRTTYATYFSMVGTTYGIGDGSTTFNVPDLRGRGIFFVDNMGGSTAGRITSAGSGIGGTAYGATGGDETVTLARANLPNVTLGVTGTVTGTVAGSVTAGGVQAQAPAGNASGVGFAAGSPSNTFTTTAFQALNLTSTSFTGGTLNSGVSDSINGNTTQTVVNKMPPSIILYCILRII